MNRPPRSEKQVIDEDSGERMATPAGDRRARDYVTRSPKTDRLVTWGVILAGSGGAMFIPRSPDPAPQIEKLSAEMAKWRELTDTRLAQLSQDFAVVRYQLARPDTSEDHFLKIESRLLDLERRVK